MRVDFNYLAMNRADRPGRRFENYIAMLLDVLGCSGVTFTGAEGTIEEGADFVVTRYTVISRLFCSYSLGGSMQMRCKAGKP